MANRPNRPGGGLIAALCLGAGLVAGVWWMVRGKPPRARWRQAKTSEVRTMAVTPPVYLRESILGADKGMVQSVFGVPRAAGGIPVVPEAGRQAYWEADVWYYALDPQKRMAMAVTFEGGVAREVEFLKG